MVVVVVAVAVAVVGLGGLVAGGVWLLALLDLAHSRRVAVFSFLREGRQGGGGEGGKEAARFGRGRCVMSQPWVKHEKIAGSVVRYFHV